MSLTNTSEAQGLKYLELTYLMCLSTSTEQNFNMGSISACQTA